MWGLWEWIDDPDPMTKYVVVQDSDHAEWITLCWRCLAKGDRDYMNQLKKLLEGS